MRAREPRVDSAPPRFPHTVAEEHGDRLEWKAAAARNPSPDSPPLASLLDPAPTISQECQIFALGTQRNGRLHAPVQ